MKNYNDAMLETMTNGVITLDDEGQDRDLQRGRRRILGHPEDRWSVAPVHDLFDGSGVLALVDEVMATGESARSLMDLDLAVGTEEGEPVSVNVTVCRCSTETNAIGHDAR